MKVRFAEPNADDRLYRIDSAMLMTIVDADDLRQRGSQTIEPAYHIHWFRSGDDDIPVFIVPAIYLDRGRAFFINGRHRTLVLVPRLPSLPMAISFQDIGEAERHCSSAALAQISRGELQPGTIVELPDLPILNLGR